MLLIGAVANSYNVWVSDMIACAAKDRPGTFGTNVPIACRRLFGADSSVMTRITSVFSLLSQAKLAFHPGVHEVQKQISWYA
jgi:hypothetical protein